MTLLTDEDRRNPEETDPGADDWRFDVERNFHLWLSQIRDMPDGEPIDQTPDMYSFFAALCSLRNDFRKNSRRSHETFSAIGENLSSFQTVLQSLSDRLDKAASDDRVLEMSFKRDLLLEIIEVYERLSRVLDKLVLSGEQTPDRSNWFKRLFSPQQTGITTVQDGLEIALSHIETLFERQGVKKIPTRGEPFNPLYMNAAAAVPTDQMPPGMIIEELSGGYLLGDNLLKTASVTVSKEEREQQP